MKFGGKVRCDVIQSFRRSLEFAFNPGATLGVRLVDATFMPLTSSLAGNRSSLGPRVLKHTGCFD